MFDQITTIDYQNGQNNHLDIFVRYVVYFWTLDWFFVNKQNPVYPIASIILFNVSDGKCPLQSSVVLASTSVNLSPWVSKQNSSYTWLIVDKSFHLSLPGDISSPKGRSLVGDPVAPYTLCETATWITTVVRRFCTVCVSWPVQTVGWCVDGYRRL